VIDVRWVSKIKMQNEKLKIAIQNLELKAKPQTMLYQKIISKKNFEFS
jgi:hypothetical protein